MLRIALISDTHGFHKNINFPEDLDLIIHSGDASNYRDPNLNEGELLEFFEWYKKLPFKKIYVPGNHDTSLESNRFYNYDFGDIVVLDHKEIIIDGIKFFGSPYTPTFGVGWAYNKKREKLHDIWKNIPSDIDVLITHGPPKGILDISENREGRIEYCGDLSLRKRVEAILPKYHVFGHIHNCKFNINNGMRKISNISTTFINATMVEDGKFDYGLTSDPIIIEL